ncbi:putative heme-binding domain-containing protein [Parapedobacter luteus]|uniref:Putative heme-binding domain-containing protein n=2 Tax=Parapedobacter luteus TaxID=623280 RepID=A0A1T5A352_9SPHI|nr:putative heme-binding domain-containing protein [Parapedobacter luteus]
MQTFMKKNRGLVAALQVLLLASACQTEKEDESVKVDTGPKVEKITAAPDFVVEHLYSPSENKEGSWVAMTFDDKGRMIVSDQFGALYRIELPELGMDTLAAKPQRLAFPGDEWKDDTTQTKVGMGYAQGLLWAFNSLYVMVNHRGDTTFERSSGLYRLKDNDNDDQFDEITLLKSFEGDGEHGPHSIILGPDGQSIYLVCGNHTDVPKMDSYLLPSNWDEDNIFQSIKDPRGHATDRMAPGGWIAKTDSLGKHWQLVAAGFRNTFDIAFNDDDELFAYDSDMEWDFGMPWYRPTRLLHVTKGAEFGWRTGNSKWATYYPDNLPSLLNIGQGSPTNLVFAGNAKFPDKYRNSLLAFDWSFGIIYAVQLEQEGATYRASAEEFLSGAPLPLTDGEIGPDGALYFLTGGRKLDSDLYRVYYKDHNNVKDKLNRGDNLSEEMAIRRQLESYYEHPADSNVVNEVWPYLNHDDRHVRYAATVALMHQPIKLWGKKVFRERNIRTVTHATVAMAKTGHPALQSVMLRKLMTVDINRISKENKIDLLRAFELVLYRMGEPEPEIGQRLIGYFANAYPTTDNALNREFSKLLIQLRAPYAIERTLSLLESAKDDSTTLEPILTSSSDLIMRNPQYGLDIANTLAKTPPAQQIYYATALSKATEGWTPELYERYFKWFYGAFGYKGGNSFIGFLDAARKLALENVPKAQFAHYNTISGDSLLAESGKALFENVEPPKGPGRNWKIEDALKSVEEDKGKRNFERGKELFVAIRCASCHTMRGEGGAIGPDLTQLGTRFSVRDMLEAIIDPNIVISDQYESKVLVLNDGSSVMGRLVSEDENVYSVSQNPYAPQVLKEIPKRDVREVRVSKVSIMPPGTLNVLNEEELKDLMAYLMAGGNEDSPTYKGK